MGLRILLHAFSLGLFIVSLSAQAAPPTDFSIHREFESVRALGMGNAFIAVADDQSAMFYNPAALAFKDEGNLRFFLRGGLDPDYFDLIDDIENAENESDDVQAITDVIVENFGENYYSRVPTIGGIWVRPNWGLALIPADLSVDVSIRQQVGPAVNVNAYLDTTLAYAYARKFSCVSKGKCGVGILAKAIHRVHVGEAISAAELANDSDFFNTDLANEGLTFDFDIGTLYVPRIPKNGFFKFFKYIKPSFAFVARNVLDYGFTTNLNLIGDDTGEPPELQRRFDFGSKFDLPDFWVFDPHFAFDVRDMGHDNWTFSKGAHLGFELFWTMYSWWKGSWAVGLNQMRYLTLGFTGKFGIFQLDVATYGEEVGTSDEPKESRRYMVEMSLDF